MSEDIEHIQDVAKEDELVDEMDIEHIKRKSKLNLDGSWIVLSCDNDCSNDDDNWKPKMDDMFKFFYQMMTNIENLPGNNFISLILPLK